MTHGVLSIVEKGVGFPSPRLSSNHGTLFPFPLLSVVDHHVYLYNACIKKIYTYICEMS